MAVFYYIFNKSQGKNEKNVFLALKTMKPKCVSYPCLLGIIGRLYIFELYKFLENNVRMTNNVYNSF